MKKHTIITAAAIVLFLAGISHLIRIFYDWDIIIDKWDMPIWISFISAIITLFLAYNMVNINK